MVFLYSVYDHPTGQIPLFWPKMTQNIGVLLITLKSKTLNGVKQPQYDIYNLSHASQWPKSKLEDKIEDKEDINFCGAWNYYSIFPIESKNNREYDHPGGRGPNSPILTKIDLRNWCFADNSQI